MGKVSLLDLSEPVRIGADAFRELQASLGPEGSSAVVERVVIDIAEKIGLAERALAADDLATLAQVARRLAAISQQLGLGLLAQVAADARACAERGDRVALHAVTGRLLRVGDASLTMAMDGSEQAP